MTQKEKKRKRKFHSVVTESLALAHSQFLAFAIIKPSGGYPYIYCCERHDFVWLWIQHSNLKSAKERYLTLVTIYRYNEPIHM